MQVSLGQVATLWQAITTKRPVGDFRRGNDVVSHSTSYWIMGLRRRSP